MDFVVAAAALWVAYRIVYVRPRAAVYAAYRARRAAFA